MVGSGSDSGESTEVTARCSIRQDDRVSLFTTDPTASRGNMMGMDLEEMGLAIETEIGAGRYPRRGWQ